MKRPWLVAIGLVALLIPVVVVAGGERGFEGVVHSIEGKYHVRAKRIPLLGLISLISKKATHNGVSGLHLAEFEYFSEPMDGDDLNRMVEEKLGAGWERIIRETSRTGDEQTLIFMHPEGERMGLFVVDRDGHELTVVEVSVDPDHLNDSLSHYARHQPDSGRDGDESD